MTLPHPFVSFRVLAVTVLLSSMVFAHAASAQRVTVMDSARVNAVWAGHPVDFTLTIKGDTLYAAYYTDGGTPATRLATVSMREPATGLWRHKALTGPGAVLGWDSHNSITMTV